MTELLEQQFLTLSLDGDKYAIPVRRVLEVLEYAKLTKLPRAATYLKGLIDLRGHGIPVLDLGLRLGLQETGVNTDKAIIVVEIAGEGSVLVAGLIADAVHEVVEIASGSVEPAPKFGTGAAQDFLSGVSRGDGGFILILDVDRLFRDDELRFPIESDEGKGVINA
jgi:purine-binding chemotaxis protein CheW